MTETGGWRERALALATDARAVRVWRALPVNVFFSVWAFVPALRDAIPVECPIIYWYFALCCTFSPRPRAYQPSDGPHPLTRRVAGDRQTSRSTRSGRRRSRARSCCWAQ